MTLTEWQQCFDTWVGQHYSQTDAAHDVAHFRRVWRTAQHLMEGLEVDALVILTACYFHDIVSLAKNDPQRSLASRMAAEKTAAILRADFPHFPEERYPAVRHAIEAHSYSAGIAPQTPEAKIVQDADRLEALGAIGLARVFAVAGSLGVALFDSRDPFADGRELNDKRYALDHFRTKLLTLPATMQTEKGRALAQHNADYLVQFMAKISAELQGNYHGLDNEVLHRFCHHKPG
ncbi:putative hydrolase [Phytobacter ursingii]|uniref:Phosphohydrolase n=1 Tax=Phytobacter ursingii TaxID=1972431 RepID=A0AB35RSI5_9ENTR|nr:MULTISPECIES: phosphohydrolase [Enterobacteriaceae]MDV2865111.1 phosphohydrolase [Phytobacter ursingii]GJL37646.1 phosphohydrolase [Enterobacter hormaechei]VTP13134.1 putative hydrolase [Phytobacter ursingii]